MQNQDTNEVATAATNDGGHLHDSLPAPGPLHAHRRAERVPEVHPHGHAAGGRPDRDDQRAARRRRLTEKVNVSAESPLLETSNADRGTVIDSARIAELPLQSRSPMALAVLVAGVNYNAQAIYLRPFDNGALADWSMNGGQNRNNEFLLDGAPNNANQGGNNIAYVPPAEAVQEMKIATNSYDAQYGRTAGGVVNMSLKSGTNSFHGVGLRLHAAQGAGRQLVPAQLAQRARRPISTSISTGSASTARSGRTRRSSCSPARSTAKARRRRCSARCRPRR